MKKITVDIKSYVKDILDINVIIEAINNNVKAREFQKLKKTLQHEITERLDKINEIIIINSEKNNDNKGE